MKQPEFECRVRWVRRPGSEVPEDVAQAHVERIRRLADAWGPEICSYLGARPPKPVLITVVEAPGQLALTKGTSIVLPLNGAGEVENALSHEMVHAVMGRSPSQVANEGLAVHVDARLRLAGDVWPFYHLDPHRWVRLFEDEGSRLPLFDLVTRPWLRYDRDQELDPRDLLRSYYLQVGSLAGFLVDEHGMPGFLDMFRTGQLPFGADDIPGLEARMVAALGGPLSEDEVADVARSMLMIETHDRADASRAVAGFSP